MAKNQKTTVRHFGFTENVYGLPCTVRTMLLWKRHHRNAIVRISFFLRGAIAVEAHRRRAASARIYIQTRSLYYSYMWGSLRLAPIICSAVGRSIADIYDLSAHIYLGALCLGKYGASVVYVGYGPPYRTIYITCTTPRVRDLTKLILHWL